MNPLDYQEPALNQVAPVNLQNSFGNLPYSQWRGVGRIIQLKVIDDSTTLTTGDGKLIWCVPASLDGALLQDAQAFVTTVSSSGAPSINIRNITQSYDILSTNITIDASEFTSYTAVTPRVINATRNTLKKGDLIAIDVDTAGTGTKGLGVVLELQ